jgi:hypothetical protein
VESKEDKRITPKGKEEKERAEKSDGNEKE